MDRSKHGGENHSAASHRFRPRYSTLLVPISSFNSRKAAVHGSSPTHRSRPAAFATIPAPLLAFGDQHPAFAGRKPRCRHWDDSLFHNLDSLQFGPLRLRDCWRLADTGASTMPFAARDFDHSAMRSIADRGKRTGNAKGLALRFGDRVPAAPGSYRSHRATVRHRPSRSATAKGIFICAARDGTDRQRIGTRIDHQHDCGHAAW